MATLDLGAVLGAVTVDYDLQLVPRFDSGKPISLGTVSIPLRDLREASIARAVSDALAEFGGKS